MAAHLAHNQEVIGSIPIPATIFLTERWVVCDCYTDKCRVCGEEVEMHLSDYNTAPEEIEVYCGSHAPVDKSDGVMWVCGDRKSDMKRVFVRALTDVARDNMSGNHPNCSFVEIWEIPKGLMAVYDEKPVV